MLVVFSFCHALTNTLLIFVAIACNFHEAWFVLLAYSMLKSLLHPLSWV